MAVAGYDLAALVAKVVEAILVGLEMHGVGCCGCSDSGSGDGSDTGFTKMLNRQTAQIYFL